MSISALLSNQMSCLSRVTRTILSVASLWIAGIASAHAQETIGTFILDDISRSKVEVTSVFSGVPSHGYAPVRVTLENRTDKDREWKVVFVAQSEAWGNDADKVTSHFSLAAGQLSTAVHDLLVPLATRFEHGGSYQASLLRFNIFGGGLKGSFSDETTGERSEKWPFIAVSKKVSEKNLITLNDVMEKKASRSVSNFGFTFDPSMLPSDWLGYSGVDILLLSDDEWVGLPPGTRRSVMEWIRFGGALHIQGGESVAFDTLGITGDEVEGVPRRLEIGALGGHVALFTWDGTNLDAEDTVARYERTTQDRRSYDLDTSYRSSWELHKNLGKRSSGSWQVATILLIFGILVGPVNLFVFAKPGRRHRLFITTPIISIATSLVLIVLILLQDGIGGRGLRFSFWQLDPEEKKLFIVQEQISRTGALLNGDFETEAPLFLSPVTTRSSPWAAVTTGGVGSALSYRLDGSRFAGDWFQSRREQGHVLQAVRSTRGRIEILNGSDGAPEALSSLDSALETLFYQDAEGRVWKSGSPLMTGQRIPLIETDHTDYKGWIKGQSVDASEQLRKRIEESALSAGTFAAELRPDDSGRQAVETLKAIRWGKSSTLVVGEAVVQPSPETAQR